MILWEFRRFGGFVSFGIFGQLEARFMINGLSFESDLCR